MDFILQNTGHKINFTLVPAPSPEYRNISAGWGKNTWNDHKKIIDTLCADNKTTDILFIGNCITQGWGSKKRRIWGAGTKASEKYFKDLKIINAGISGDRVEHVLWRVRHLKSGANFKPRYIVLTVGVNNFFGTYTGSEIAKGIIHLTQTIARKFADSKIVLFGPLPTGLKKESAKRAKYNRIHENLATFKHENVLYYNALSDFTDQEHKLNMEFYAPDGIHLKPAGYEKWAEIILKKIAPQNPMSKNKLSS